MLRIRLARFAAAFVLCSFSLGNISGQTSTPIASAPMFAPYVDMSKLANTLPQIQAASGIKALTLAFIVSGNGCVPAWGKGTVPVSTDTSIAAGIGKLTEAGDAVIIAFGGYDGTDLGQSCTDVQSLQAAYQAVIDKYKAKVLDFDVEHTAINIPVSIDRRSQALKALVAANPGLQINYTLPATPAGMTDLSVNVIKRGEVRDPLLLS